MFSAERDRLYRLCPCRDQYLDAALRHAAIDQYAVDSWTGDVPGIVAAWANAPTEAQCRDRLAAMLVLAVDVQCIPTVPLLIYRLLNRRCGRPCAENGEIGRPFSWMNAGVGSARAHRGG
jgi:hypothetical protein